MFRGQTCDLWTDTATGESSQRKERDRRDSVRRERINIKKIQVREK